MAGGARPSGSVGAFLRAARGSALLLGAALAADARPFPQPVAAHQPLDDVFCALQQDLATKLAGSSDAAAADTARSAADATAAAATQDAAALQQAAQQEREALLVEASAAGASAAATGAGGTAASALVADAGASSAAAALAATSADGRGPSGVQALTKPGAYYGRRQQQPLPRALDKTLESLPRLGNAGSTASHVFSLFSAGAAAAVKNMAGSWLAGGSSRRAEPAREAASAALMAKAEQSSPAGLAAAADLQTRVSPGAASLVSKSSKASARHKAFYKVDSADEQLRQHTKGLAYRVSKNYDNRDSSMKAVPWGSTVQGIDEGDGWLKVDHGYLPFSIRGSAVLALKVNATAIDAVEAAEAATTTCPFKGADRDSLLAYTACLAERCEDWDPAIRRGISCEETFLPLGCESDLAAAFQREPEGTPVSAACPALCGRCSDPLLKLAALRQNKTTPSAPVSDPKWVPTHQSAALLLATGTASSTAAAGGVQQAGQSARAKLKATAPYLPSVRAQEVQFTDRDPRPDYAKGPVVIKKAADERTLEWYSLWWAQRGHRLPASKVLQVLRKTGADLQFDLPRTKVPEGADGLMVTTGNSKGEMHTGPLALLNIETGPSLSQIFEGFLRGG